MKTMMIETSVLTSPRLRTRNILREVKEGVATLTFDRPESVANLFDAGTLLELDSHLDWLEGAPDVRGVILTMFDGRNNLSHQVAEEIRRHFPQDVFEAVIPRNVRLSEAPSHGLPVLLYDIASRGATAYLELAREIIEGDKLA